MVFLSPLEIDCFPFELTHVLQEGGTPFRAGKGAVV